MKPRIVVIGAGLAGLSAAYKLATSQKVDVTVLERRERLGGRTYTTEVNGQAVDLGGFIIYPWYRYLHKLISDLGLHGELEPFVAPKVYIESKGRFIRSARQILRLNDYIRYLSIIPRSLFRNAPHMPGLWKYGGRSVGELLGSNRLSAYFDTLAQGYCYGSVFETSAATTIPVMVQSFLHGDIKKSHYFPDGIDAFTERLANEITARGGEIILGARAEAFENGHVRLCTGRTFAADAVVYAADIDGSIPKSVISFMEPLRYTNFATAILKVDAVREVQDSWGALFLHEEKNPAILSVIHLERLHGEKLKGYVAANVRLDHEVELTKDFFEVELMRRGVCGSVESIETTEYWNKTMPILKERDIAVLRETQGKSGLYFAGDWLGCPSMESAVANGVIAAEQVLDAHIK
jgi:protoporphyrinogen oxidase